MNNVWFKLTGVSGALAVSLGAIGAHMILKKDESMKETWKVKRIKVNHLGNCIQLVIFLFRPHLCII
jgi:hypothetical protein